MIRVNLGADLESIEEELNAWPIEEKNTTLHEPEAARPAPQQQPLTPQPAPPSASDEQVN